uniref:NADH dehydrogenase [ubiquinone] 1 alpha subcomplex subunit 7 n=1 Tax=Junco hyemalis TaxID=40217 RepID=A0A8C5JIB7_JUNHY
MATATRLIQRLRNFLAGVRTAPGSGRFCPAGRCAALPAPRSLRRRAAAPPDSGFALQRDLQAKLQLRYEEIAKRTQPPPRLPVGPSHKFADNYYCSRDGRRESLPPMVVATALKTLPAGAQVRSSGDAETTTGKKPVTPGPPLRKWEISRDEPYL